jgi:hypothetical protein
MFKVNTRLHKKLDWCNIDYKITSMEMTPVAEKAYEPVAKTDSLKSPMSPKGGHALEWSDVCYQVQEKIILKNCWGKVIYIAMPTLSINNIIVCSSS